MHDVLIKGGTVIDGSGKPGFTADVAIANGRIAEVGRIDSLNRFAEMDLDLGEAEDEARFGEQRFDRRGDRLGVGQTAAPQEAQQGKTEVNEETSEGAHREWGQAIGFPSGGEAGDRFLIG